MTITHNGKLYNAVKMGNGYTWQLTEVGRPRNKLTLNRFQMHVAGLLEQVEGKS